MGDVLFEEIFEFKKSVEFIKEKLGGAILKRRHSALGAPI